MRRENRSMIDDAIRPAAPAANVYDETIKPNCVGPIVSDRMSCGPSGITTMKSTILVNCTAAKTSNTTRSVRFWHNPLAAALSDCDIKLPRMGKGVGVSVSEPTFTFIQR